MLPHYYKKEVSPLLSQNYYKSFLVGLIAIFQNTVAQLKESFQITMYTFKNIL